MLIAAFANHDANSLMQKPDPPVQKIGIGVQTKMQATTVAIVYATITAMIAQHHNWNVRVGKTRWYCIKIASLVRPMDAQYVLMLMYRFCIVMNVDLILLLERVSSDTHQQ